MRERIILRRIKAEKPRNIGDISRFSNAELAKKGRSQLGSTSTSAC